MGDQAGTVPDCADPRDLRAHFAKHGGRLRTSTAAEYDASARKTIENGRYFTYRELDGEDRVGYYDRLSERLTVLTDDEQRIVTHFRCPERYVQGLPSSTYP